MYNFIIKAKQEGVDKGYNAGFKNGSLAGVQLEQQKLPGIKGRHFDAGHELGSVNGRAQGYSEGYAKATAEAKAREISVFSRKVSVVAGLAAGAGFLYVVSQNPELLAKYSVNESAALLLKGLGAFVSYVVGRAVGPAAMHLACSWINIVHNLSLLVLKVVVKLPFLVLDLVLNSMDKLVKLALGISFSLVKGLVKGAYNYQKSALAIALLGTLAYYNPQVVIPYVNQGMEFATPYVNQGVELATDNVNQGIELTTPYVNQGIELAAPYVNQGFEFVSSYFA